MYSRKHNSEVNERMLMVSLDLKVRQCLHNIYRFIITVISNDVVSESQLCVYVLNWRIINHRLLALKSYYYSFV